MPDGCSYAPDPSRCFRCLYDRRAQLCQRSDRRHPDESLTIFDRAYYSAAFLLAWQQAGAQRHWLMRAKSSLRYEVIRPLGDGDAWARLPVSPQARRQHPQLPVSWEVRLIVCPCGRRYLTSLADVVRYPADQVAACYRERWEIELGFRDIKQAMQANNTVLRSKRPERVRQEIWGLLIAYNLLRWEMHQTADELGVPPTRLSFRGLRAPSWPSCATPCWKHPVPFPNDLPASDSKPASICCPHDDHDHVRVKSNDDPTNTP